MAKTSQIWTVRNLKGQFIATYFAYTAEQAIDRLIQDERRTAGTFRRSQPSKFLRKDFTAAVEPRI